ncbi:MULTISPECIES: YggT family protein [Campylobacter]|uniref:Putative membrane protein, YGGT family n=1 Tax=Campylobacter porcelli TaxID=1660073 RepID=A0A1X9SXA1_9BACT|nr:MULTISPECIES: YggT family protein [unclassified Campylobacter]MCR8678264.1 YggT family protein [Campylobacter sp. RM19072]MCR8695615.1 YggT family protein [Campylobacter sp. RM19073]MEE3704384.1 YggT family protein [Campylobacter sp. CX2-8023-23]MEE3744031.1 YggT family protein [Campylobacter sp. CX2-4855-23]MEE3776288.1 YggT family protein [Campylobacter sp. CX2-4080-23]
MNVLTYFIISVVDILDIVIKAYMFVIIAAALISWVRPDPFNPIVQLLYRLSAPAYGLIRKLKIPTAFGGIDIAPIIILLSLEFISRFVLGYIRVVAYQI